MSFSEYIESFAGLKVQNWEPGKPITDSHAANRIAVDENEYYEKSGEKDAINPEQYYSDFFKTGGLEKVQSLVFGCWNFEGDGEVSMIVDPLVANAEKLPNLKSLFIGDVISEDCEISWLEMSDVSALWKAFPKLEILWIRGSNNLSLGKNIEHANLKELVLQSGGLPKSVVEKVLTAKLPNLEHLELWLGDEGYGADTDANDFETLFSGSLFPKLKYLGLCNSEYTDTIAEQIASSPLLDRLETLDLSGGTLGDEGAEFLLKSEKIKKLKKLDLHHHYLTNEMMKKLKQLPCETNSDEQEKADEDGRNRYISVSE